MTTETFQDLSLTIPSQEMLSAVSAASASAASASGNEGWVSWFWSFFSGIFYGPNITLEDCLAYFFSADELKGDNMYSCEKCKSNLMLIIINIISSTVFCLCRQPHKSI